MQSGDDIAHLTSAPDSEKRRRQRQLR